MAMNCRCPYAGWTSRPRKLAEASRSPDFAGSGQRKTSAASCAMGAMAGCCPSDQGPMPTKSIFKGDQHRFAEGEYISIKERDGITRVFRVASVQ